MLHYHIKTDFDKDINPAIILSRIERLISFEMIYNHNETIGKYTSRRFYYNKDFDKYNDDATEKKSIGLFY